MTPINTIYSEMGIRETVLSFGNTIEIGTWPVIRRRASNPAPGDNDTQSNFGCSR